MKIVDWWNRVDGEHFYQNYFVKLLQQKYNVIYSDKPDFILYSCFGDSHLKYDCVRIFFTGENISPDYNITDYAMSFDYCDFGDRHIRLPLMFWHKIGEKTDGQNCLETRNQFLKNKTKFCSFVVSNGALTQTRDKFFDALCSYKRVDSAGRWKNNMGYNVKNKIEWLKSYKFNLCFENSSQPGYLTEKLFDAFMSGCVPIYWGDTSLLCKKNYDSTIINNNKPKHKIDYSDSNYGGGGGKNTFDTRMPNIPSHLIEYEINPKAFINAHNFSTFEDLIDEIRRIDNDNKAFADMLNEPVFLNNFDLQKFYSEKAFNFLDYIVSQGPILAKRRGYSIRHVWHENNMKCMENRVKDIECRMKLIEQEASYFFKHRRLILMIKKTSELPRDLLRKLRKKY